MFLLIFLYLTGYLSSITTEEPIQYKPCDNGPPDNIESVVISPCTVQPCVFHHNMTVNVDVTFTARNSSSKLTAEIFGIVAGLPVPFSMPNPDGCKDSGMQCPIKTGQQYTYRSTFNVIPSYPNIRLLVKWDLKDENKNYEFCFVFPMEIN